MLYFDDLLNYMPHVLSCFTCLVNYVLSCSTCLVIYVLSCPKCPRTLVPYLLSCPTFSPPHTSRAQRVSCASCSCASHALSLAYSRIPSVSCVTCFALYAPPCFTSTFSLRTLGASYLLVIFWWNLLKLEQI